MFDVQTFDWQAIAVALIILAACSYTARRAWARLRSLRGATGGGGANGSTCATGCGGCGESKPVEIKTTGAGGVLVQIGRASGGRRAG